MEAYFPGYGWQTFDPTPAGNGGSPQGWSRALYVDAMSSFWREWIISYDTSHQFAIAQTAFTSTRSGWRRRRWAREHYESMLRWAKHSQDRIEHSPGRWAILGLVITLLLLLLGNLGRIARLLHEKWLHAHPERSPEQAAAMWYRKMAQAVAQHWKSQLARPPRNL